MHCGHANYKLALRPTDRRPLLCGFRRMYWLTLSIMMNDEARRQYLLLQHCLPHGWLFPSLIYALYRPICSSQGRAKLACSVQGNYNIVAYWTCTHRLWGSASLKMLIHVHFSGRRFSPVFCLSDQGAQTNLFLGVASGFVSRSVHARLQVSMCSSYDLCIVNIQTDRQTAFDQLIWRAQPDELKTRLNSTGTRRRIDRTSSGRDLLTSDLIYRTTNSTSKSTQKCILHSRMRRCNTFGRVRLSVCLSCSCSNFWMPWPIETSFFD